MVATAMFRFLQSMHTQRDFSEALPRDVVVDNFTYCQNGSAAAARRGQLEDLLSQYATQPLTSAAHFGLATGLLLALAANWRRPLRSKSSDNRSGAQRQTEALLVRFAFALVSLLCAASLAPLLTLALFALALYRRLVGVLLAARSPAFAGLLDGTDAVWALDDDASRSVINVLAVFEVEVADHGFQPPLIHMLRRLIRDRILTTPDEYPKFWQHRRRSRLGYFYWERQDAVRVDEHVQYMTQEDAVAVVGADDDDDDDDGEYRVYGMSESVLKELLSELVNSPLPCDDAASWEVLVGRDPILEDHAPDPVAAMEEGASSKWRRFPVLFRVHHAMGDGVALIKLLLDTLADRAAPSDRAVGTCVTEGRDYAPSLIDAVDLIPCLTGEARPRAEARRASEIPTVVVSTANLPLAITVDSLEYEIERLFLADEAKQADGFVVIDSAQDGADNAIYFGKEGAVTDDKYATPRCGSPFGRKDSLRCESPRCESPVPPFARLPGGRTSPTPRRFESPVPKIHRKKYPCLSGRDSSASSSEDVPSPRDFFLASRTHPKTAAIERLPLSRSGTPLLRNDDPVPRCNSPLLGAPSLPLSSLSRLRNHTPVPDAISSPGVDLRHSLENFPLSRLRRRRSFKAEDAVKLAEEEVIFTPKLEHSERVAAGKSKRAKIRRDDSSADNRYMRLLESTFRQAGIRETLAGYVVDALSLVFAPASLIHRTLARESDANALHGRRLSGEKLVTWFSDAADGEKPTTLDVVRRVKVGAGASFTDVLLSAVSASLREHFLDVDSEVPPAVSVVVPARMPSSEPEDMPAARPALENKFSVAVLSLPVGVKSRSPLERLKEVAKQTALLRQSPDYLVNFWLMKVLAKYLPLPLLAPLLDSKQSTLVVSNLCGPSRPVVLSGYKMTELVFWVPNRGSTGLGVSVLSYAGRLHLGLVADCALVGNHQQADSLLGDLLSELRALDEMTPASSR